MILAIHAPTGTLVKVIAYHARPGFEGATYSVAWVGKAPSWGFAWGTYILESELVF